MNVEAHIKTEKPIPLKSRTIIHLSLVQNKINESIHAALKPFDISLQQFNVLRILRGQKGAPANLNTINERMVTNLVVLLILVTILSLMVFRLAGAPF